MPKKMSVASLQKSWSERSYSLFIAALGYEERSRFIAEHSHPNAARKIALAFDQQKVHAFVQNLEWFSSNDFHVKIIDDNGFRLELASVVRDLCVEGDVSILVDISSISRIRLALIVECFSEACSNQSLSVDFVYALAEYTSPPASNIANSHVGPVLASFAGWPDEPDRAITAIVGLGYEQDKALGAAEHLQADDVWAFMPVSEVQEYSPALIKANQLLLDSIKPDHLMSYRVQDPFDCFIRLESLVYGLSLSRNPVLLPFGPKLFALCCLLVATAHRSIPVWRVSAQELEPAMERRANGSIYGLSVIFTP